MGDLLDGYRRRGDGPFLAWDEMFDARRLSARRTTARSTSRCRRRRAADFDERCSTRDRVFRDRGITFAYLGEERPFPLDLVPRVVSAAEWATIELGVRQRVLRARAVPRRRVRTGRRSCATASCPAGSSSRRRTSIARSHGIDPPGEVRVHVAGIDLVRDGEGRLRVLEDNLRTPSGISYVVENRRAMTHVFPELFASHRVRPVSDYPTRLLGALRATAPTGSRRSERRRAHARRAQRRVLRALVPRPPDGCRARRGSRPLLPRQRRVHAHDRRRGAGRRHLPPHRRRVPRPAPLPPRLGDRLRRAC